MMLAGGLGNQMFQLAAALSREADGCRLDVSLSNPRINTLGNVDVSDFELGQNVTLFGSKGSSRIISRVANYMLISGMQPNRLEKFTVYRNLSRFLSSIFLQVRTREMVSILQGLDNGYFEINPPVRSEFLVGYFQSYRWFEQELTQNRLRSLKLKVANSLLDDFLREEKGKESVLMHVRLGDYKQEDHFGILDGRYFERALHQVHDAKGFERIWLFSDEPDEAMAYVPTSFQSIVRVVPDFGGRAALTLEAMRHANSYIIANSSLSWWGASLSYTESPLVIAPAPWFKSKPEPRDLIPQRWQRIKAWD